MTSSRLTAAATDIPRRGSIVPRLDGRNGAGDRVCTRDFYMRRNLAIVFAGDDDVSRDWVAEASSVSELATAEAGQVLLVVHRDVSPGGLPSIIDHDGMNQSRFGLGAADLPALFITDRYGTLFATSHGHDGIADLRPRDIPRWLEFVACRCS
ncbi:MAG TPA: hypothetical protein VMM78_11160 [Thermomicrobiales bacterium]|nr:hypothetical protein [Thermomicrobiales bacterium]